MEAKSDPESTFTVADCDIEMTLKHLIAFKLFIGGYSFAKLQRKFMDCVHYPRDEKFKNQLSSFLHWKTALKDGLVLMKEIRESLKLKGDVVFQRDMPMKCVVASVFGIKESTD